MELRAKIALEADSLIVAELGELFEWDHHHTERERCAGMIADAILAIPEIRDALAEQRLNAMSPAQFGEKLLAPDMSGYDNPRKQDRRYKKPD